MTSSAFFGSAMKSCASSSACSHALTTSGRCLIRSARMATKPASSSLHGLAGGNEPRETLAHQARCGWLPHHRGVELAHTEVRGDRLDVLIQVLLGLDVEPFEGRLRE